MRQSLMPRESSYEYADKWHYPQYCATGSSSAVPPMRGLTLAMGLIVSMPVPFRLDNGIVHALPPERAAHYARFIEEYERIRAAEGRGSESEYFYLGLPYTDISGRNGKQWQIRARSYDYLIKHCAEARVENRWTDTGSRRRELLDEFSSGGCRLQSLCRGSAHQ